MTKSLLTKHAMYARHKAGESYTSIAESAGVTWRYVRVVCSTAAQWLGKPEGQHRRTDKAEIYARCQAGETLASIGKDKGLTRERIRQICLHEEWAERERRRAQDEEE